jgi:hypothetical protein
MRDRGGWRREAGGEKGLQAETYFSIGVIDGSVDFVEDNFPNFSGNLKDFLETIWNFISVPRSM